MPEALASGAPPYQEHYPDTLKGSVQSPPTDYAAWGELCRRLTEHLVARYGRAAAREWYWEVWNEPDIAYWHGTQQDYDRLYDFAAAGVRAALPEARVGGPATTGPGGTRAAAFLDAFLLHVSNDKSSADGKAIPLDFISFHAKGKPALVDGHVQMGLTNELHDVARGFAIVSAYPQFKKLPIILSEADPEGCAACSARENPANGYRNGPLYPAYTAVAMKALFDLQDRYQVNLISMLSWSFEFEGKDFFQGFRTLATNGVDKPVMNIFRMAGMMTGDRVATSSTAQVPLDVLLASGVRQEPDIDALATRNGHTAAVLLWNYQADDLLAPPSQVTVTLDGVPAGVAHIRLEQFRIDDQHSNAYTVWKAMGSPQQPTPAQFATLQRAGHLEQLGPMQQLEVHHNSVTLPITLPRHAISLFRLTW